MRQEAKKAIQEMSKEVAEITSSFKATPTQAQKAIMVMQKQSVLTRIANYLLNINWILKIVYYFISNEKKEKIELFRFQKELEFWGVYLTQEQIKESLPELARIQKEAGFTCKQIAEVLNSFSKYTNDQNKSTSDK